MRFDPALIELILSGRKRKTTRKDAHAIGEEFVLKDGTGVKHRYRITDVERVLLSTVALKHYKEEGFESSLDFIRFWHRAYPIEGYVASKRVYMHSFEEVSA